MSNSKFSVQTRGKMDRGELPSGRVRHDGPCEWDRVQMNTIQCEWETGLTASRLNLEMDEGADRNQIAEVALRRSRMDRIHCVCDAARGVTAPDMYWMNHDPQSAGPHHPFRKRKRPTGSNSSFFGVNEP